MSNVETLADYDGMYRIIINPTSTSWRKVARETMGDLLIGLPGRVKPIYTDEKEAVTQEEIASEVKPGDVLVSAGGDGGDALVATTLLTFPGLDEEVRRTPVLSIYGGNANQGPGELTPKRLLATPSVMDVISKGVITDIHPLEVSTEPDNSYVDDEEPINPETRLAVYFSGIGATGISARELNQVRMHSWRKNVVGRNVVDGRAVLRGISIARKVKFDLTRTAMAADAPPEVSAHHGLYEAGFINGDRIAKIGRFPSSLTEEQFFQVLLSDGRWPSILRDATRMRFARLPGVMLSGPTTIKLDYETQKEDDEAWAHLDGDQRKLANKGSLTVAQYPTAYRAVTTKNLDR